MIFTKEMFEKLNLPNIPTTNELDTSSVTQGKITKELFKFTIEHFSRLNLLLYCFYIPSVKVKDFNQWIPVSNDNYINSYEHHADVKLSTISIKDNIKLMVEKLDWSPSIIFEPNLEGIKCNEIICHVLGINDIEIKKYKNKSTIFYKEARMIFPDGINWAHIKIG